MTTTPELPQAPGPRTLPDFLDDSPAGPLVVEYRRMISHHQEAVTEHRAHHNARGTAEQADREARATALRTSAEDPGDKHQETLNKNIASSRRDAETAAAAAGQVWAELRKRLTHADMTTWADQQTAANQAAAERIDRALTEATEAFTEITATAAQAAWLDQAAAHCRGETRNSHPIRWPHQATRPNSLRVEVGTHSMTPADVIALLADTARTATT